MTAFVDGSGPPATAQGSAPGRVNLLGEHTDYNGGLVLPTAIPQRTTVAVTRRDDDDVRVVTTLGGASGVYRIGHETPTRTWLDYVEGCTWALGRAGVRLPGLNASIVSEVPPGSGLSSSAALEVACLRALRALSGDELAFDDVALARIAHRAEVEFVGARVGMMDQMAVSLADDATALLLDTRDLRYERVPLPPSVDVVVIDSGVRHRLAAGGYNERRAECERAAALLGVTHLCALGTGDLGRLATLPTPLDRRARHVVTEHARVAAAAALMRRDDAETLGLLLLASHASQRDDYAVSVPEIDALVELAWSDRDVYGARLTGGGFGGSVVALARRGTGAAAAARVASAYSGTTGRIPTIVMPVTS